MVVTHRLADCCNCFIELGYLPDILSGFFIVNAIAINKDM